MKKTLFASLLLVSALFAQDEYIFRAKGEFAKELKALIEKHAQNGQVVIQKVEPGYGRYSGGIVDAFLNDTISEGDIAYGKELYDNKCYTCHGKNAEHSTYANARVLKTLSKDELISQLTGYAEDPEFGQSTGAIMRPQAQGLTTEQVVSIASYIYSIDHKETQKILQKNSTPQNDQIIDLDKKSFIK